MITKSTQSTILFTFICMKSLYLLLSNHLSLNEQQKQSKPNDHFQFITFTSKSFVDSRLQFLIYFWQIFL